MSWIRYHSYEVAGRACWRANFEDPFVSSCPVYSPLNVWTGLDMGKMTEHTCMLVMLAHLYVNLKDVWTTSREPKLTGVSHPCHAE